MFGHAVAAAKIAPVGHRQADVGDPAAEAVDQSSSRTHHGDHVPPLLPRLSPRSNKRREPAFNQVALLHYRGLHRPPSTKIEGNTEELRSRTHQQFAHTGSVSSP